MNVDKFIEAMASNRTKPVAGNWYVSSLGDLWRVMLKVYENGKLVKILISDLYNKKTTIDDESWKQCGFKLYAGQAHIN